MTEKIDGETAPPATDAQDLQAGEEEQDVYADYGVARAFSLAASILDAGQGGLTKAEIRDRVEHYRSQSEEQSQDAWERLFSRDKDHLRSCGIAIEEPAADREDYRYRIDPADYGLPPLPLSETETLVLSRATQLWAGSRTRSWLEQASWALAGPGEPPPSSSASPSVTPSSSSPAAAPAQASTALSFNLGSDEEFERLTELAALEPRQPICFDYTGRGAQQPEPRRVVLLDFAARGHWYLIGHDLDRGARRTFRLDRVHGPIGPLRPAPQLTEPDRAAIDAADVGAALDGLAGEEDPARLLRGALEAHEGPAPKPPRLAPAAAPRRADPAHRKVERVLAMAAYLLSADGVRPSELLTRHQITPKQLLKDLLSIQQSGSFGPGQYGEFIDIHPAPPLNLDAFTQDYLVTDAPITLAMPSARTGDVLARPLTLTKPGALSLLIALNTMISAADSAADDTAADDTAADDTAATAAADAAAESWVSAAESLRGKIARVLPAGLQEAATKVAAGAQARDESTAELRAAVTGGCCVELRYEDASGTITERVVEPTHVYIDGPRTYLQAWCRLAQGPRNFLGSRIRAQRPLPEEPISETARLLAQSPAEPPRPPQGSGAFDVVLRFSPAAAALADRYAPQRQRIQPDGVRIISTWFQSREALIRLCLQLGGDLTVLVPAEIREKVTMRAREELSVLSE
ncbi:helix-turn-helix transcriptional regulator [Nesterenkonia sp. DZ6]|uniref:helix-turn-helix transcriptional regulator n=1 Tax=Nesterenkonia sp. DZ6 TaxID=2901229 RepID=UPI001F4C85BA|nr:WYL domain-containing protein [Nesterenkonia sp. DZ6]